MTLLLRLAHAELLVVALASLPSCAPRDATTRSPQTVELRAGPTTPGPITHRSVREKMLDRDRELQSPRGQLFELVERCRGSGIGVRTMCSLDFEEATARLRAVAVVSK